MFEVNNQSPSIIVVDSFYKNPSAVIDHVRTKEFQSDNRFYKGVRSSPLAIEGAMDHIRKRFEDILGKKITRWSEYSANGCFQMTDYADPLVYHCDQQDYAAAIYLTQNGPTNAGTSFWKDKNYGYRKAEDYHKEAYDEVWKEYNLLHQDNWELVDRVGSVFNRLVIWNGHLIHSASTYSDFNNYQEKHPKRLVQLFFFDVEK